MRLQILNLHLIRSHRRLLLLLSMRVRNRARSRVGSYMVRWVFGAPTLLMFLRSLWSRRVRLKIMTSRLLRSRSTPQWHLGGTKGSKKRSNLRRKIFTQISHQKKKSPRKMKKQSTLRFPILSCRHPLNRCVPQPKTGGCPSQCSRYRPSCLQYPKSLDAGP
ncbi:transmembrane protein, putative [Rhizoctonia solani AG-3 Rhs1AP]|uniref:Transmembrane protein, putative n=1 Tax=Rhizoctonia solani AG-3 Rhs1AP TaxID=1086054 RepID=X8JNQ1_9AGAM|nr:transmembrane protein, putative [Rhizoctonia solani AG-3 Rhs1AP]